MDCKLNHIQKLTQLKKTNKKRFLHQERIIRPSCEAMTIQPQPAQSIYLSVSVYLHLLTLLALPYWIRNEQKQTKSVKDLGCKIHTGQEVCKTMTFTSQVSNRGRIFIHKERQHFCAAAAHFATPLRLKTKANITKNKQKLSSFKSQHDYCISDMIHGWHH